jgi:hypothetical protein
VHPAHAPAQEDEQEPAPDGDAAPPAEEEPPRA